MFRRVDLTDDDLELAAQALRALAVRYRKDAERQSNPVIREEFEKHAFEAGLYKAVRCKGRRRTDAPAEWAEKVEIEVTDVGFSK